MGCERFHDFVSGATITVITPDPGQPLTKEPLDILRGNERAQALMAEHLRVLQTLGKTTPEGDAPV